VCALILDAIIVPNLTFLGLFSPEISFGEKQSLTQTPTYHKPQCSALRKTCSIKSQSNLANVAMTPRGNVTVDNIIPLRNPHAVQGSGPPFNTMCLRSPSVFTLNSTSILSAVFARCRRVTDRRTDQAARSSVAIDCMLHAVHSMLP